MAKSSLTVDPDLVSALFSQELQQSCTTKPVGDIAEGPAGFVDRRLRGSKRPSAVGGPHADDCEGHRTLVQAESSPGRQPSEGGARGCS